MKPLAVAMLLLLSACSSQPVEPTYYLLRGEQEQGSRPLAPLGDYALGLVTIAPYVDQPGLLMQTAEGDIRPARHHLWAEPVYEGARIFLLNQISLAAGRDLLPADLHPGVTQVDIRIDQLHGTYDGQARLVAYWWLRGDGRVSSAYKFSRNRALAANGYAALVAAEEALLTELAGEIAAVLVAAGGKRF